MSKLKIKRTSYEAGFKLKVVEYAEMHGNAKAMRELGINEKLVRDWRKIKETLTEMPKKKRACRGMISTFPTLEAELNDWVVSQRQDGYIVTRGLIRFRALQLKKDDKHRHLPGIASFFASAGWCTRFMERHSLTLRQRTKLAPNICYHSSQNFDLKKCFVKVKQLSQSDLKRGCTNINNSKVSITERSPMSNNQNSCDILLDIKIEDEYIGSDNCEFTDNYDHVQSPRSSARHYERMMMPLCKVEEADSKETVTPMQFSDVNVSLTRVQIPSSNASDENDRKFINIHKESLRFIKAPDNPLRLQGSNSEFSSTKFNIEFSFDCEARCDITLNYFCTKETANSGYIYVPQDPSMNSQTATFESGSNQKFTQESHIFEPSKYLEETLLYSEDKKSIPIVIYCSTGYYGSFQSQAVTAVVEKHAGAFILKVFELNDLQNEVLTPSKRSCQEIVNDSTCKFCRNKLANAFSKNRHEARVHTNKKNLQMNELEEGLKTVAANIDLRHAGNADDGCSKKLMMKANPYQKIELRSKIIDLRQAGQSAKEITKILNISETTVYKWIHRYEKGEQFQDRHRCGRARSTTEAEDTAILQILTNSSFTNAVDIKKDLQLKVSTQTVRNRLHAEGIQSYMPTTKEKLSEVQKDIRLIFARQYADEGVEFWSRVIFTDEATFSSTNKGKTHYWRRLNNRYEQLNIYDEMSSSYVSCNVWGWICHAGLGELVQLEQPFNSDQYLEILEEVMLPTVRAMTLPYPEKIIYMHVKSPIHTSRIVQTWFDEQADIELLDWPSKGYDINPIENVWDIMVNEWEPTEEIFSRDIYHHSEAVWEGIRKSPRMIERMMIESIPNRLREIVEKQGGWIGW